MGRRALSAHIRQNSNHVAWNGSLPPPVVAAVDSTTSRRTTSTGFVPGLQQPTDSPANDPTSTQMPHGPSPPEAGDFPHNSDQDDFPFLDCQSTKWPEDEEDEKTQELPNEGISRRDESSYTPSVPEVPPAGYNFPNNPRIWSVAEQDWIVNPYHRAHHHDDQESVHAETHPPERSPGGDDPSISNNPDTSLVERYIKYCDSGIGNMVSTPNYKSDVKLLKLLKTAGCPIYLFNQIKEWAHESAVGGDGLEGVKWLERSEKRTAVLKDIRRRFDLEESGPTQIEVTLPGSGEKVTLTLHDFKQQVYSLLSDPVAMSDENLLFHDDDPFKPPPPLGRSGTLNDVNDGSVYHDAYKVHCKIGNRDVLACPIFFIDKTHVDVQGRLCLEPVTFTLSIFKKEARSKPLFWRTIGYVTNQSHLKKVTSIKKAEDYHFVLERILQSVVAVQQGSGLAWKLMYNDKHYNVVFKLPVLFVIGDTEGHDKLVGKFNCRTGKVQCLCRICDTKTEYTDDPTHTFCYTKAKAVADKVEAEDTEGLRLMSYHCIVNAFRNLIFCDPDRGINGAVPGELLHVWQLGLFLRFLASLFGQKRARQTASRKKRSGKVTAANKQKDAEEKGQRKEGSEEDGFPEDVDDAEDADDYEEVVEDVPVLEVEEDDEVAPSTGPGYVSMDHDDITKNGVFTDKVKLEFDEMAKEYGKCLRHQSDREFNRAYFPTGITTNCKKNGSEERCVLMLCLIIFLSHKGAEFDGLLDGKRVKKDSTEEQQGNKRSSAIIEMISQLLLMENFLKAKSITVAVLALYERYVPCFLGYYKTVVARQTGLGLKIIKFHLPLHSADDMARFGPAMSWDSSTGESNHKDIKEPARHTQRNTREFEKQTAVRHQEDLAIDRAHRQLHPPLSQIGAKGVLVTGTTRPHVLRGANYYVDDQCVMFNSQASSGRKEPTVAVWPDSRLQSRVLDLIVEHILPCVPKTGRVKLSTELKVADGTIYRANPSYGKMKQPWHDWADINWVCATTESGWESIPGRLVIYIDIEEWEEGASPRHDGLLEVTGIGQYVLVESLIENLYVTPTKVEEYLPHAYPEGLKNYLAHPVCSLVYWSQFEMEVLDGDNVYNELVPKLYVISVDHMQSPRIVVPFDVTDSHPVEWLIIEPAEKWDQLMVQEMETVEEEGWLLPPQRKKKKKQKRSQQETVETGDTLPEQRNTVLKRRK